MPQTNQYEKIYSSAEYDKWKEMPLEQKLVDWENINTKLFSFDCGILVLGTAINYCDTLLSCVSMVAAGGAVTLRLRLAVEQHMKLEYLYDLYKSEINKTWPENTAKQCKVDELNTPDCIKLLEAIGLYLPAEKVITCKADPNFLPQEYHDALEVLGIQFQNAKSETSENKSNPPHKFNVNNHNYIYNKPAVWKQYLENSGRLTFYGLNSIVGRVNNTAVNLYVKADNVAGPYVRPALSNMGTYLAKKAEEILPTRVVNAAKAVKKKVV